MESPSPATPVPESGSPSSRGRRFWQRSPYIGLQYRVMAYAFIGMTTLAAIFAFVALDAVDESSDAILRERLNLATTVAHSIDQTILASISLVARTASDLESAHSEPGELTGHQTAMLVSLEASLADVNAGAPPQGVVLFDLDGNAVWSIAAQTGSANIGDDSLLDDPGIFGQEASPVILLSDSGEVTLSIGSDISPDTGLAYLGALILPSHRLLTIAGETDVEFGEYRMELLDSGGSVIANSSGNPSNSESHHLEIVAGLISDRNEGVGRHAAKEEDGETVDHIVAYAPLSAVPWGVVLEQREDTVLALPNSLRRRIIIIAAAGLAAGLAMAWITSRQVVRPLTRLTGRAQVIAEGDLSGVIAPEGQDEIRRLAESFETMRGRLEESRRELSDWSRELEGRVRERTAQLEQRDRERDVLLNKIISAQEDERKRIARDLHDQIGQTLTALVMQIGGAEATLEGGSETVQKQLASIGESASSAVEEVRRMMSDLRPSILDDMGLESAVNWYAETHLEPENIDVVLDLQRTETSLSPNVEISAFRVFQESITNIIKHAGASRVRISLAQDEGLVRGEIQDDGRGFEVSAARPGADGGWAVGLLGMTERVGLLGGSLRIDSRPGEGTTVSFEIPLGDAAGDARANE